MSEREHERQIDEETYSIEARPAPQPVAGPRDAHQAIADGSDSFLVELALSQDSLEDISERSSEDAPDTPDTIVREEPRMSDENEESTTEYDYESLENSRSYGQPIPSGSENQEGIFTRNTLESDDITARLQPLIPSGAPSFIANVFDKVIPELQQSLDAEYKRSQSKLESEHKARLQSLHSQHHHQQFELYEKVIALQDQVQKLEDELNTRNKIVDNLSAIVIRKMNERTISEVLAHWRQQCELRREEKKRLKMVEELHRRNTLRKYVNMWKNSIKSKWKAKVEKVCKERATEICIKLKDDLTCQINKLEQEVKTRDEILEKMEKKHGNVEENLSKALMRGICALNMEAMSVLQKPQVDGHQSIDDLEFANSNQQNNGYPLVNSGSRQNSIVNSIAPQPRAAVVASNVYLDTVSSLDDFAAGNNSRRLKVRNSSEFTGSMAGSRRIAPKPSKGPVTYKHDPRDGAARRVKDPRKPNEPWKPVGSKTKREDQQRPPTGSRHGFTAVKHY